MSADSSWLATRPPWAATAGTGCPPFREGDGQDSAGKRRASGAAPPAHLAPHRARRRGPLVRDRRPDLKGRTSIPRGDGPRPADATVAILKRRTSGRASSRRGHPCRPSRRSVATMPARRLLRRRTSPPGRATDPPWPRTRILNRRHRRPPRPRSTTRAWILKQQTSSSLTTMGREVAEDKGVRPRSVLASWAPPRSGFGAKVGGGGSRRGQAGGGVCGYGTQADVGIRQIAAFLLGARLCPRTAPRLHRRRRARDDGAGAGACARCASAGLLRLPPPSRARLASGPALRHTPRPLWTQMTVKPQEHHATLDHGAAVSAIIKGTAAGPARRKDRCRLPTGQGHADDAARGSPAAHHAERRDGERRGAGPRGREVGAGEQRMARGPRSSLLIGRPLLVFGRGPPGEDISRGVASQSRGRAR